MSPDLLAAMRADIAAAKHTTSHAARAEDCQEHDAETSEETR